MAEQKTINSPTVDKVDKVHTEHIIQFFSYKHLPSYLAEVSAPFALLADSLVKTLPRNPERTVALRKLLEASDAAVRAMVAKKEE